MQMRCDIHIVCSHMYLCLNNHLIWDARKCFQRLSSFDGRIQDTWDSWIRFFQIISYGINKYASNRKSIYIVPLLLVKYEWENHIFKVNKGRFFHCYSEANPSKWYLWNVNENETTFTTFQWQKLLVEFMTPIIHDYISI